MSEIDVNENNLYPAIQPQKLLGAYYSPREVCQLLSDWAIQDKNDNILEPSFGGCCFLETSLLRLKLLGAENPTLNLYGCDIDAGAFLHLHDKVGIVDLKERFLQDDFLKLKPSAFKQDKFDVVIGNPPYVSHHNTSDKQKEAARLAMLNAGHQIARLSSLWGYFVLHSLEFLADNGRIAWILPWSFMYAEYAKYIQKTIYDRFLSIRVVVLQNRLFLSEGTEEGTVIVFGEGYGQKPSKNGIALFEAKTPTDLSEIIAGSQGNICKSLFIGESVSYSLLNDEVKNIYSSLKNKSDCYTLGEIADVKIGTVTGANKFFIFTPSFAEETKLISYSRPILAKFTEAPGLSYSKNDHNIALDKNRRCLMLDVSDVDIKGSPVRSYLASFPRKDRRKNVTFRKRLHWYSADDGRIPDAFFTYMHHSGPRMVINAFRVNCTNTIHRIFFKNKYKSPMKKLIAISVLTTFTQLSAEIEGRCYGSGVLKLEPSEVKRLSLLIPKLNNDIILREYNAIDKLLRQGKTIEAMERADNLILKPYFNDNFSALQILRDTLNGTRKKRHVNKNLAN